jgi:valyl-tRNA synthetase
LLHPFMPHITEELWSLLGLGSDSIQFAAQPEKVALDDVSDVMGKRELVSAIYETIQAGRNLRAEFKLPSNRKIQFILRSDDKLISGEIPTLTRLLNAEEVKLDPKYQAQAGNPVAVTPLGEIFLTVAAADRAGEQQRLDKEIARIETEASAVEEKLKNKSFVDRAPAAVVEEHRRRLKDFSVQLEKLKHAREVLN